MATFIFHFPRLSHLLSANPYPPDTRLVQPSGCLLAHFPSPSRKLKESMVIEFSFSVINRRVGKQKRTSEIS